MGVWLTSIEGALSWRWSRHCVDIDSMDTGTHQPGMLTQTKHKHSIHSRAEMWRNVECRMVVGTHIEFLWQSCEGGVQIETNHREGTISSRIKTSSTDPFYFNRKSWEGCNQSSNYRPGPGPGARSRSRTLDTNCCYQRRWGGSARNSVAARQGSWSL